MNITHINYFLGTKEENEQKSSVIYKIINFLQETKEIWSAILKRNSERRQLAAMNDYQLRDIGLTRADVSKEVNKWFWQI